MESELLDLLWERIPHEGLLKKQIGKSKISGIVLIESIFDENGREVERRLFHDNGELRKWLKYEYDSNRKPLLISGFDNKGKLVYRQERGKPPDVF